MGYNQSGATSSTNNMGSKNYKSENKLIPGKIILTPKDAEIDTEANAKLKATYDAKIKQATGRWYVTPPITEIEDTTADSTEVEFPNGDKRTIALGDYGFAGWFDIPDAVVREIFTTNNKQWDGFIVWQGGLIEGRNTDGVKFVTKRIKEFLIDKRSWPDGTTVQRVRFVVTFDERKDFNENTIYVEPTAFNPMDLDSVRDVVVTNTDAGSTQSTVTVKDEVGEGVEGLVLADFDDTGSTPTLNSISDDGGGTYTATWSAIGASVINLVASASISIDDYIESTGSASATIT